MTADRAQRFFFDDYYRGFFIQRIQGTTGIVSKKNRLPESQDKGFTLLEVMVSVSIIAFIFVSIFRMQSATIDLVQSGKFNTTAPMLAKKLLNDVSIDPANWSKVEGDFGENFPGIQWRMDISESFLETDDFIKEDNQARFKKFQIEIIKSAESSGTKIYQLTTWRFVDE